MSTRLIGRRWLRLLAIAMVATALGGWFQASPPSGTEVPPPTIRVSTHLVLVDVVVTNKQGKPVAGLHPEDFVVEENGKVQKIANFVIPGENTGPGPSTLPPGIYSNRQQYRAPGGPITVMLLDALNTSFSDQAYARRQMLSFVHDQYRPSQRLAIFALTDSLRVLQDFTSDPQILYSALQRYIPQPREFMRAGQPTLATTGSPTAGDVVTSLDASAGPAPFVAGTPGVGAAQAMASAQAALQSFEDAQVAYAEDQRTILTLNALSSLSRILGGLPGRKNLIWVTGRLPLSLIPEDRTLTNAELAEDLPSLNTRRVGEHAAGNLAATFRQLHAKEIRETAARLSNAQVAVYPIDARGLSISLGTDSQETMREMARETGGRAYVNQNEIKVAVVRAFDDTLATYTLGYYPENKKYDGKYRTIKVKVKQEAVDVQHRRGYFAIDPTQTKGYNPQQDVGAALGDAVPARLVAFSVCGLHPAIPRRAK